MSKRISRSRGSRWAGLFAIACAALASAADARTRVLTQAHHQLVEVAVAMARHIVRRHAEYEQWIVDSVLPFLYDDCGGRQEVGTIGASMGAYHALMYGRSMYFDLSRTKQDLGWSAKFGNDEMFIDSYEWYLAHRELVLSQREASHHRSAVKQGVLDVASRALSALPT